jgi:superfamily I DNA/RNA helicase
MSEIIYTIEQENIFKRAQIGVNNIIVEAVAGAGKTTTLVECVKRILAHSPGKRILLLAHNKSTRDTLKKKIGENPCVKIYTLHGLAYRIYQENFNAEPNIVNTKYRDYVNKNINSIATETYNNLKPSQKLVYKNNVFELIDKARHNLCQSEKEIRKMAIRKYNIVLIADECHMVANILKWGYENREIVDFQDLLYFPSVLQLHTKKYLNDFIMLDEAQDASLAQQDVVKRCFKRDTRMLSFGDKDQTINSWCGSDTEAFERLGDANEFNKPAERLPLTTNYRCGKKIIEYAKKFTTNLIKPRPDAEDGEVNYDVRLNSINLKEDNMILCRNTAPLMELYRWGVANKIKMYFRGEELGQNLKIAVDCAEGDTIEEIIKSLKKRLIATWEFITIESELNPRETMTYPIVVQLYDNIKTLENLPSYVDNREKFNLFVDELFTNEGQEGIQLSTIHRAKGLEADNVYIICPSLIPSRLAVAEWEKEEEKHLQYVMCTRPKSKLCFITEKDIRPNNAYSERNSFYDDLIEIKKEIQVYV